MTLNHTTSPALTLIYSINGTSISPSPTSSALGLPITLTEFTLPAGHHQFQVNITPAENGSAGDTSLIHGASISSSLIRGTGTRETVIEDSAWRTGEIRLTDGWNMLETPFENSNFIDTVSYAPVAIPYSRQYIDCLTGSYCMGSRLILLYRIWSMQSSLHWEMIRMGVCHSRSVQDLPCRSLSKVNQLGHTVYQAEKQGTFHLISMVSFMCILGDGLRIRSYSAQLDDQPPQTYNASGGPRS